MSKCNGLIDAGDRNGKSRRAEAAVSLARLHHCIIGIRLS